MNHGETILISQDCPAVLVPAGTPVRLPKGTEVQIMQALGSSYTISIHGNLARVAAEDAAALGQDFEINVEPITYEGELTEGFIRQQLTTIYDPEIPVNIVDLGLIYEITLTPQETEDYDIHVNMTLTAPGCGIGPILVAEVEALIRRISQVKNVIVDIVFDPPWNRDLMSEAAQLQLGML